ncbi:MAG: ATP phosphoribosyltransferase [Bacteroidales bacterium]|jgi:ATP phosphoribosyltransferase|nr:ATP phosphoribosyltransferase [Bacteroidales bacterium]
MIRIAVQAKGRLSEESIKLLSESGLSVDEGKRKLLAKCGEFPLEVLYLRDDDIPGAVAMGVADLGIVGMNEVEEKMERTDVVHKLGFSKCRLSLAIPKMEQYTGLEYFNGKIVATSYPSILERFFKERGIDARIHRITGSVEVAPSVGMADAIFDIVSSGGTLVTNGLKEVESVFASEAVLIANPSINSEKREVVNQIISRFESVERSRGMKYLLLNLPEEMISEAAKILPGMRSPTILPLAQKGWCSIHVVVDEKNLWSKMESLKAIGAEGILVLSLEKILP